MFRWTPLGGSIVIGAIVAGLPWGAAGVATAYSAVWVLLVTPLLFWYVGRRGPVRAADFYRAVAPVAFAALGVMAALASYRRWAAPTAPLKGLAACCLITAAVTPLLLALLPGGRRVLGDTWATAAMLAGRAGGRGEVVRRPAAG
jgi:PST family polysaccharide transporter